MGKKGKRARGKRREERRQMVKDIRAREKLNRASPGGSAARAIGVATPAVIGPMLRSMPCHQCGGELEAAHAVARMTDEGPRRVATTRCKRCHSPREIWFVVGPTLN